MLPTVPFPPIRLDDYVEAAGAEAVERLRAAAEPLRGSRMLHVNSTAFGGGVAELLLTHLGLLQDLGIDVTWQVIGGDADFFTVTKAVHNALQGAPIAWTDTMEAAYLERIRANAQQINPRDFDVFFIHDPQPCALLAVIEETQGRSGTWLWRCHIDTSDPNPDVWGFFAPYVNRYDAAVFTMDAYAHEGVTDPEVAFITPTIDPLSMKNVSFDPETAGAVLRHYGIDRSRPLITQVSRFDPWKDPNGVIDAYRLVKRRYPEVQLALVGSMAHDDPEGWEFLRATQEHAGGDPDIHLLTNLENVGNLEVNAFQRASTVIVQKSLREGFGLVVSEAMWKGKPVVGGNVGGIALQIEDGVSGYLVDSVEACADRIIDLLADPPRRLAMGRAAHERVRERFLTLTELTAYLELISSVTSEVRTAS